MLMKSQGYVKMQPPSFCSLNYTATPPMYEEKLSEN